jgi:hypothetical protein
MKKVVTINYMDIELVVTGYYEEGTDSVQYNSDLSGYPGDPAIFEADEIYVSDSNINIIDMFISLQLQEIEDLVLIKLTE